MSRSYSYYFACVLFHLYLSLPHYVLEFCHYERLTMEQSKSGTKEGDIGFIFGLFVEKESHFPQPASFCKKTDGRR